MEVSIEVGKSDDLLAIDDIYNHYVLNSNATFDINEWDCQLSLEWFEQFTVHSGIYHLLVAKLEGQVIGFAYNSMYKEKPAHYASSEVTVYISLNLKGVGSVRHCMMHYYLK